MDFKTYLQTSAKQIDQQLEECLEKWRSDVKRLSPKLTVLSSTFVDACKGGKRLRGVLVKLGYELTGSQYTEDILKPAAAFEIFQTAILAHDDIVDQSPTRRGKPTVYKALGGDHYGISQTICLADIGFFLALKQILDANFSKQNKNLAASSFVETMLKTGTGQMLDIEIPHSDGEKTEDDAINIFLLKTARYTIVGPLHLGAILGGSSTKLLSELEDFGNELGVAFQIKDDILGVFGDEETIGKSVTSDIEEGKNTLLITEALKRADDKQRLVLDSYYGKGKIDTEGLEQIRRVFIETGSLDYSQKKSEQLVEQAKTVLEKMQITQQYKDLLSQMADFIISRQK